MSDNERPIDWTKTTFDGSRHEQLRQAQRLTVRQRLEALEQLTELSERLQAMPRHVAEPRAAMSVHEPPAEYRGATDTADTLPEYTDTELASLDETTLIAHLRRHGDHAPRNLIDTCAGRGDTMVEALAQHLDNPAFWADDIEDGDWWLRLHTAMILGLIPTEAAGRRLVDLMRRLDATHDDDTQDWLAGNWPALFANKPINVAKTLRTLAEDRACDTYIRVNAAEPVVRLAHQTDTAALEAALDWIVGRVSDEQEEWDARLGFCHILLDFPRDRYRPLLERLAAQQIGLSKTFDAKDIEHAHAIGRDQPGWERFNDPWKFYRPEAITARQRRWAEEDRQNAERSEYADDALVWHEPYVRPEPKIGRNDPCPCGSGKKYKKCCLDKGR